MSIFEMARELAVIQSAAAVIGWDQETYLPPKGAAYRAEQLAWLSAQAHALATSADWQQALENAEASEQSKQGANLRELRREFDRARKLPVELVTRASKARSLAKHAWAEARLASDFAAFAPHLETLVEIAKEKADLWGYPDEPYDALLEGYERGTRTADVLKLFTASEPALRKIGAEAVAISNERACPLPPGPYPVPAQKRLNAQVAEAIGYDFQRGRIDTTTHPFCTSLGPSDVRLTTRYDEHDFTSSLFGVLHEAGHGIYEQGLPDDDFGLPAGSAASLGIHESQSRLWENHVGRSREFWEIWYPAAIAAFPQLQNFPLESFLAHVRRAAFSEIRVEADEATYDLHIFLRFQLERQLIRGDLQVKNVPEAWNDAFAASFGRRPQDDRHGCLQDIHWAMGGIGYFPTYSLGNIHAAQLFAYARQQAEIASGLSSGNYRPLREWLHAAIHRHGAVRDPQELIAAATAKPASPDDYLVHLTSRYLHAGQ